MASQQSGNKYANKEKKRRKLLSRFKLDNHHKMERFAVSVGVLSVFFVLNLSVSALHAHQNTKQVLSDKAVYTVESDFSKTGIQATTTRVYRSDDNQTAYVVFKLENTDVMSLNAKKYMVFVRAYDSKLKHRQLTGQFFVLGSTGYMGVMLYDAEGFANQVLDITIRANAVLTNNQVTSTDDYGSDASFKKYDQLRLYANPGAKKALSIDNSVPSKYKSASLYDAFIGHDDEHAIFNQFKADKNQEKLLQNKLKEYLQRLKEAGYEKPTLPEWVDRDFVLKNGFVVHEDYSIKYGKHVTSFIDAWFDGSREDYLAKKQSIADAQATMMTEYANSFAPDTSLVSVDGRSLDVSVSSDTASLSALDAQAMRDYAALKEVWTELLTLKFDMQYKLPMQLLNLENDQIEQSAHLSYGNTNQFIVWGD